MLARLLLTAISSSLLAICSSGAASSYDVVVYGATPAGVLSALASSGEGSSVLLLDPRGWLGGCMSGGLAVTDIGVTTAVIGGRTRAFFEAVARHYNSSSSPLFNFEPHVAEKIFTWLLAEASPSVTVRLSSRIVSLSASSAGAGGRRITSATLADGTAIAAAVWVDATYEGSLLPLANLSFVWGREPVSAFDESVAGVLPVPHPVWTPDHPLTTQPQPWWGVSGRGGDGAPLPGLSPAPGPVGSGDAMVQSYSFRVTLTWNASNMLRPWPRPAGYDRTLYGLLEQAIAARGLQTFAEVISASRNPLLPGVQKLDWNNHNLAQFYLASPYPAAVAAGAWAAQEAVWTAHRDAILGLFYFLSSDAAVPASIRDSAYEFGLPLDEHAACGHFPCQLYVREALRLQGAYIFTQGDVEGAAPPPRDSVGRGAYTVDVMHGACFLARNASTGVEGVLCEGGMQAPSWLTKTLAPFQIPLRALLPRADEAVNVIVPVAISSSHVGFNAVRLEPTWMTLGESAGVAAAWAANRTGGDLHALDVYALQARLWELGQIL